MNVRKQIPVTRCQYCEAEDIGIDWQHGHVFVTLVSWAVRHLTSGLHLPPQNGAVPVRGRTA